MDSKIYVDYNEMYKIIIPSERKNNKSNIILARNLKNSLIDSENELKSRLEKKDISYKKPSSINLTDAEKYFLRSVMYKSWFYNSELYGKVKLNSKDCCYCMVGKVQHLDHFFNKNDNPELSVSTINLVPSCSTCNERKLQESIYIHPYYEDINEYGWLSCNITWLGKTPLPLAIFSIIHPSGMPLDMYKRLEYQLSFTDFFSTINENAADEISSNWDGWKSLLNEGVPDNVLFNMLEGFKNKRKKVYGCNSWQFALYEILLKDFHQLIYKLKS